MSSEDLEPDLPGRSGSLDQQADRLHALVGTDEPYQRIFRVRQARWRELAGLPIGDHRGVPLGSRLAMPHARDTLANYLTDNIRSIVRAEVVDGDRRVGKLYGEPRIFNDLLSSQPMCFNLFGEMALDLALASRVFNALTSGRIERVTRIGFEHSPGRGDAKYTGDRSAFDVFVEYRRTAGKRGFLGIEVKYHENMKDRPGEHRDRYDEIATAMGCFEPGGLTRLRERPLQQVWRDHLLAGSLLLDVGAGYDEGVFVFLYPSENVRCLAAVEAYAACLLPGCTSFVPWTLEAVVAAVHAARAGAWIGDFAGRYLGMDGTGSRDGQTPHMSDAEVANLEAFLGFTLTDRQAAAHAFWEDTFAHDLGLLDNFVRLAWLGDRVLNLALADRREAGSAPSRRWAGTGPQQREQDGRRAVRVWETWPEPVKAMLRLGNAKKGRANDKIIGTCAEAVVGLVFRERGYDVARAFVWKHWPAA
jgi:hypothetical protein